MVESKRSPLDLILVEKRVYYKDDSGHNGTTTTKKNLCNGTTTTKKNCSWISGTHWNVRLLQNALAKPPNSLLFGFPAFSIL